MQLSWDEPSDTNSIYDGYIIRYTDSSGNRGTVNVGREDTSATVDVLRPSTTYEFEVLTVRGTEESNPDECGDGSERATTATTTCEKFIIL